MVLSQAASASLENLFKIQSFRPHPRPIESETLRLAQQNTFEQVLQVIWFTVKLGSHCVRRQGENTIYNCPASCIHVICEIWNKSWFSFSSFSELFLRSYHPGIMLIYWLLI